MALPEQKVFRLIFSNYENDLSCKNIVPWPGPLQGTTKMLINLKKNKASVRALANRKSRTKKNTVQIQNTDPDCHTFKSLIGTFSSDQES